MQSNEKLNRLNKMLPSGAKKTIAKKTGLSYNTVNGYFRGRGVTFETESKIIAETTILLNLAKDVNEAKKALLSYEL
ncbi:hypothetical protein [Flavobacterium psychrophilum]|uniref:hypothetical protein n=1 Tax=Flavobacterium psychrophilum TaxID=96345 RepID=UPI00106BFE84|nr:hypothetical protein [Flavobacterium psychrophilum]